MRNCVAGTRGGLRRAFQVLALAGALAAATPRVEADEVRLKDGRVLDGKVVAENDLEVKIELLGGAALMLPRKEVVSITRGKSLAERIADRLAALHPALPDEYVAAATQCFEHKPLIETGRRCLLVAAALLPARYSDLEVRVGESYLGTKDKALAAHHFRRALLADPTHEGARTRVQALPAEERGAAADPLHAPAARSGNGQDGRHAGEPRGLRTGERVLDPEVAEGRVVWHAGKWMTLADKRAALGPGAPADPAPAWLAEVAGFVPVVPAGSSPDALLRTVAAWGAGHPPGDTLVRMAFLRGSPDAPAGQGPSEAHSTWQAEGRGVRLVLYDRPEETTRARAFLVTADAEVLAGPLGFDLRAVPGEAELTAYVRVRAVHGWLAHSGGREVLCTAVVVEPVGFELRAAPGGAVLARWK